MRYEGVVGEALKLLKYQRALWLGPDLAAIMHKSLNAEYPRVGFDLIVPVPLFRVRRRARGFNQSAILAHELGRRVGIKSNSGVLRRNRPTTTQTNLTASQRLSNVKNAFDFRKEKIIAGKSILLVDDVMTTGATVNACAKALKKGGAASVHVLTVARG